MMNTQRSTTPRFTLRVMLLASAAVLGIACAETARANPLSPTASDPGVTYTGLGTSNTDIGLDKQRTIIDWRSFNISSGETTRFFFGSNGWIVLNRVPVGSASINGNLFGCLDASCGSQGGNIWVYAADGVLIGPNARVNAGGFLATTSPLATSDSDFLAGTEPVADQFDFGSSVSGSSIQVASGAQINAANGSVALVAPQVTTAAGSSVSASGTVLYGAAQSYRIKFAQNFSDDLDLVDFEVPAGRAGGTDSSTPINVAGNTTAGKVFIASVSKADVANAIIDVSGSVTATSASAQGGDIVLSGDGDVNVSGQLSGSNVSVSSTGGTTTVSGTVTAQQASGTGGNITVTAPDVVLASSSKLDASGTTGGTILVGGDVHGGTDPSQNFSSTPVATANTTTVANGAIIKANGTSGAGGKVVVWSNSNTNFAGSISATGNGGDGGFVETSGGSLQIGDTAFVDTTSIGGSTGTWLQDPSGNFVIANTGGNEKPSQLVSALANNNIVITASNDITVTDPVDSSANLSAHNLTFEAGESININANITLNGSFVATANDWTDLGTTNSARGALAGAFTMASGTTIDTSKVAGGTVTITIDGSQTNTSGNAFTPGAVTLYGIKTGSSGMLTISGGTALAIDGTINAGTGTVDLGDAAVGPVTEGVGGSITAGTLTGSSTGATDLNNASNAITTLAGFTNTSGDFTLNDSAAPHLIMSGTIDVTGHTLTLTTTGSIAASSAVIKAATLTGSSTGGGVTDFSNSANVIGTLAGFSNANSEFTLDDSVALVVTGTLDVTGHELTLVDTGGGINASGAVVKASTLTGSSTGAADFSNASNVVDTLGGFTNTGGAFSLTDTTPLTISGTLNASGQTLTLKNTGGGIDESGGTITAATLTGSSVGGATFTGTNLIGAVNGFTNTTGGGFTLFDGQALDVTGTIDAGPGNLTLKTTSGGITLHANLTAGTASGTQTVALDSAGAIDQVSGKITANTFTGYSTGGATLTQINDVSQIMGFTNTGSGGFSFTDDPALTVSADINSGTGDLTLTTTGASTNGIILNANLIAGAASGAQTVTLTSAGTIVQTGGTITAGNLTGSSVGGTTLNDANAIATLNGFTNTGSGNFSLVDARALTVSNTLDNQVGNVTLTTTGGGNNLLIDAVVNAGPHIASFNAAGDFIQNDGTLEANAVNIVAGGNILIGEKAFTDLVAVKDPNTIDQAGSPFFTHSVAFTDHVFVSAQTVSFTAPQRIVMENTGNLPTDPVYMPAGFSLNHTGTIPVAILIGGSPQVVDVFGTLIQNGLPIDPRSIATTTQVEFAPGTVASNHYLVNGCIVHQTGVCTIVSFDFKGFEPAKLAELVLASASGNEDVEEDLTITGAGNDEIWAEQ
jgi:filamentous hemagglutinin family protein